MEAMPLLLEIKPVNPRVTDREFVSLARVERIFLQDNAWLALTVDNKVVVLLDPPIGEAATDG